MLDTIGGVNAINAVQQYFFVREKEGESAIDQEVADLGCNNCRIQPKVGMRRFFLSTFYIKHCDDSDTL